MSVADPVHAVERTRRPPRLAPVGDSPPPAPPRVNWSAAGVVLALAAQAVALIAYFAALEPRVAAIEDVIEPLQSGQLARIDERTLAIQSDVADIKRRLEVTR